GEQLSELDGRCEQVAPPEASRTFGERGEGEPVPRRDHLVVTCRLRTFLSDREQSRTRLLLELAPQDRPTVLERLQQLGRRSLLGRPRICESLDAVRIGV